MDVDFCACFNYGFCFYSFSFVFIWFMFSLSNFSSMYIYLNAFLRVLNGAEEEGAIDQRISIIHQHHFLAQNARHVSLLVSCERWENKHSRVIIAVLSFVFNLGRKWNVKSFFQTAKKHFATWSRKKFLINLRNSKVLSCSFFKRRQWTSSLYIFNLIKLPLVVSQSVSVWKFPTWWQNKFSSKVFHLTFQSVHH